MKKNDLTPPAVLVAGFVVGFALWFSGVDMNIQHWLMANYDHGFNLWMRGFGVLGEGRVQLWACVAVGLYLALRLPVRGISRGRLLGLALLGMPEQLLLWLRGRFIWAKRFAALPPSARVVLAAVPLLALGGAAQLLFKIITGRPRPKEIFWNGADPYAPHPFGFDAGWWSFPSGHSVSTFVVAVWLAAWFPRYRLPLLAAAVVLAASRFLATTPHYLGDVVGGAALGAALALAMFNQMQEKKKRA